MILIIALLAGLAAGLLRALWKKRAYQAIPLKYGWLILVAYIPQWLAFYWSATSSKLPAAWAPVIFSLSELLLFVFIVVNYREPLLWLLGVGFFLNFIVVILNGGLMPISPETVRQLIPNAPAGSWEIGSRLGTGKDIVLTIQATRLWFLSDRFLLPPGLPFHVAFSLGDIFIAIGGFWLLWSMGGPQKSRGD